MLEMPTHVTPDPPTALGDGHVVLKRECSALVEAESANTISAVIPSSPGASAGTDGVLQFGVAMEVGCDPCGVYCDQ
jgi:hypothetical protein